MAMAVDQGAASRGHELARVDQGAPTRVHELARIGEGGPSYLLKWYTLAMASFIAPYPHDLYVEVAEYSSYRN